MHAKPTGSTPAQVEPAEEVLQGGNTSVVVRVGDTVRRHTGHWTPAVHALLAHLSAVGFTDAPTVLGIDERGREILPFVVGEVGSFDPLALPEWFRTLDACIAIGDWLRRCHLAQRGFTPDPSLPWRMVAGRPLAAGEVVAHHDVGPYNTIRRPDGSLTVIDWDFCAPGDPIEDLAFACWSWAPLWSDRAGVDRWFGDASVEVCAARLGAVVDGYRAGEAVRTRLLPAIQLKMHAHADGLEALAARGDPAAVRLFDSGGGAGRPPRRRLGSSQRCLASRRCSRHTGHLAQVRHSSSRCVATPRVTDLR